MNTPSLIMPLPTWAVLGNTSVAGTYVATLLIACALVALLWRRHGIELWLALFPLCAVWQVPAALIITTPHSVLGISPTQWWSALAAPVLLGHLGYACWQRGRTALVAPCNGVWRNLPLRLLLLFLLYAIATALTLPFVFEGMPMHVLGRMVGDMAPPEPLKFNLGHVAQIYNAAGLVLLIGCVAVAARPVLALGIGIGLAAATSVAATLLHRAVLLGIVPHWPSLYPHNPSYNQSYGPVIAQPDGWLERASLPFIEPSYASAWYAALVVGAWLVLGGLFGALLRWRAPANTAGAPAQRRLLRGIGLVLIAVGGLMAAALAGASLVSVRGITGIAAVPLAVALSLLLLLLRGQFRAFAGALVVIGLVVAAVVGVARSLPVPVTAKWQETARAAMEKVIQHSEGPAADETVARRASDRRALEIFRQTFGIGAGLGSHRSSGYLHAVAANLGVIGLLLFVAANALILWRLLAHPSGCSVQPGSLTRYALVGALTALAVACAGGIPDLNWAPWWAVLVTGAAACGAMGRSSVTKTVT